MKLVGFRIPTQPARFDKVIEPDFANEFLWMWALLSQFRFRRPDFLHSFLSTFEHCLGSYSVGLYLIRSPHGCKLV